MKRMWKLQKSHVFHIIFIFISCVFIFWIQNGGKGRARTQAWPDRAGARRHFGSWAQVPGQKYEMIWNACAVLKKTRPQFSHVIFKI